MPPRRTKPVDSYPQSPPMLTRITRARSGAKPVTVTSPPVASPRPKRRNASASATSTVLATPVESTIIASVDTAIQPPAKSKLKSEPEAEVKPKRRKVQPKSAAASQTAPPTSEGPTRILIPLGDSAPSLLPATLSFPLPHAVSHLSTIDPRFAGMFTHLPCRPFHPPLEEIDPFRTLVTSIIGQQVSWMAARAINNRFRALFGFGDGERYGAEDGFPTPMMVSKAEVAELKGVGLSTRKAEYVISLSEHFVSGELSTELLRDGTDEEIAKALIAVRGIGQWTVDMFLMFSLRRPDVLPVGDLGVQKGLLRWALAAHGALPKRAPREGKASDARKAKYSGAKKKQGSTIVVDKVDQSGDGELDTRIRTPEPEPRTQGVPPTPITPAPGHKVKTGVLHTPNIASATKGLAPPTPQSPTKADEVLEVPAKELPPPAPAELLTAPTDHEYWDSHRAAPLLEGLSVEVLRARLAGKKVKGGAYLTPREMEVLTDAWKPYRSLGVYYMWPAGEDF